jgi:uncharacterized protein (UPF0332 family)
MKNAEEIRANLARAEASIEAARKLAEDGFFDFSASRSYYASFYAATALILSEGMEFGKHSGVIAAIHRHFIKTGKLEKEYGRNLNWLFELRAVGDYGVTAHVPPEDVLKAIEDAASFLEKVQSLLKQ